MIGRAALLWALLGGVAVPALAQEAAPPPASEPAAATAAVPANPEESDEEEILVVGQRERGAVIGDIKPEVQLNPADIRSYGVSSVAELLTELSPQTQSVQGRGGSSIVLLNGLRVSSFSEIRDIPTEAIQRVDILPEEVALKYGFAADQKVVNIVLRRRFRATTAEVTDKFATDGGANTPNAKLGLLRITPEGRFNIAGEYSQTGNILEKDRDIRLNDDAVFDQRPFRTLLPSSSNASLNAIYARGIAEGVSATINGRVQRDDTRTLLGLSADGAGPLIVQNNDVLNTHLGSTINGAISGWQWTFTGNYDRVETETRTSVTADRAKSTQNTLGGDFSINGTPFALPAGGASFAVRLNSSTSDFESRSTRGGLANQGDVQRDIGGGRVNLDLPIASRAKGVLGFLGTLSINGNAEIQRLSDFGSLYSYGAGSTWSPFRALNLVASYTNEDGAPTAQQLGNPQIITPGVRVFDLVTNQSAIVTQITGGNPGLLADNRQVFKLGATLRPFTDQDLSITANFTSAKTRNLIGSLSFPTADIQAAFPDRFIRDDAGNLIQIDARPVNFASERTEQLRWGINFSKRIQDSTADRFRALAQTGRIQSPQHPASQAGGPAGDHAPAAGSGGGSRGGGHFGGFGGGGGPGGGGGGRIQFALYHTWHFKDEVLVRPGGPLIDLLNGGSLGRGGGQPTHEIEAQAGVTRNGLGARLSANWQSATTVDSGSGLASDRLRFGDLTTVDFRLFANLGGIPELVADHPWLRGTRLTVSVDNIFNQRQRVTDATGTVPVNYQPDLLDPTGRTIRVSFRKLFFSPPQRHAGPRAGMDD